MVTFGPGSVSGIISLRRVAPRANTHNSLWCIEQRKHTHTPLLRTHERTHALITHARTNTHALPMYYARTHTRAPLLRTHTHTHASITHAHTHTHTPLLRTCPTTFSSTSSRIVNGLQRVRGIAGQIFNTVSNIRGQDGKYIYIYIYIYIYKRTKVKVCVTG